MTKSLNVAPHGSTASTTPAASSTTTATDTTQSIEDWFKLASEKSGEIAANETLRKEIAKRTK